MNANDPALLAGVPAAKPPPGVVPNHINPYSDGPILIIVGSVLVFIMLLFVVARIFTKVKIKRRSSPDDYTCVIAAVGTVCYFIIAVFAVTAGRFGTHMWDLTVVDISSNAFLLTGFFTNWTTAIVWPFAKLSFFLMYIQIFRPMKWLRYSCYAGATFNVLLYTAILAATLALTVPGPGQTFLQVVQSPRQDDANRMPIAIGSLSLALDVYILVLPIAGVSKLQLPLRRKIGVIAVFLTGLIACIASSLGIYFRWKLQHNTSDLTYTTMPVILMSLVEMTAGVIASCMPSMSSLLHHLPSWETFSSQWTSRFSSNRVKSSGTSSSVSRKRADYEDLKDSNIAVQEHAYEMAPVKSLRDYTNIGNATDVRTFVHTGKPGEVEEDGIHLQYNVEQESNTSERGIERIPRM